MFILRLFGMCLVFEFGVFDGKSSPVRLCALVGGGS